MHSRRLLKIFLILGFLLTVLVGCTLTANVTITFDSMGGSKIAPRTVFADTTSLELPTPEKDGYIFDGWFYSSDFAVKVDSSVIPTESATFYAKWSTVTVTISFLDENDIAIGQQKVNYASYVSYKDLLEPPYKEGYVGEWRTEKNIKVDSSILSNITENLKFKAFYIQNYSSISYYVSNQDKDPEYTYLKDDKAQLVGYNLYGYNFGLPGDTASSLAKSPHKEGYSFLGWYYDKQYTDKCINLPDKIPNNNLLLYAYFINISEMYKYVTYSDVTIGAETGISITGLTALGKNQATIAIPSSIDGKKVIGIGRDYVDGAAESYRVFSSVYLTNIIIPETVISIGSFAFAQNTRLKTVTVNIVESDNMYNLTSIGSGAFAGCTSLKEINIPDSVATIGSYAFAGITKTHSSQSVEASIENAQQWAQLDTWYLTDMSLEILNISEKSVLTNLKSYAFYNTTQLLSINLPKSLTHIDYTMFDGSSLESIAFYPGNTDLINIDDAIYSKDGTTLFYYPIYGDANFTLHPKTTQIEPYAFYNNKTLESINFNSLMEKIGEHAFENAKLLSSVNIDSNSPLYNIGSYAFAGCDLLNAVVFPRLLNTLGEGAFAECINITNIAFEGNSLNSIPAYAFYGCENLLEVTINSNVKSIGDYAFYGCLNLTDINVDVELSIMDTIGSYAFANCVSLELVTLPTGLKTIGSYAFAGIETTMKVRMDLVMTQLISIGAYSFANNNRLDKVAFPQTLLSLGEGAFENCTNINNLTINSATSLVELPNRLFYNCINIKNTVIFPLSIQKVGDFTFFNCTALSQVTLNNVNSIGKSAFENCSSLREGSNVNQYILPAYLATLGERAFANCTSLTSIHISNTLKALSAEAFINCTSLTSITYNANYILETIGENSFAYCTSLTSFDIPSTLLSRGENQGFINNPFYGCSSLLRFTSYTPNTNNLVVNDDGIILEKTTNFEAMQLYSIYAYPTGRGSLYEVSTNVSYINDYAFYGSRVAALMFTAATPEATRELITLVKIGNYAFANCDMLTSVNLSKRIYEVGDYAFNNCKLLTQLTIDSAYASSGESTETTGISYVVTNPGQNPDNNNLMTIGKHAFAKIAITSLEIVPRIININEHAFSNCYSLLNINFVDSFDTNLLTIGDYAFYANNGLTSLVLPVQLKSIGQYAFAYCVNITDINFKTSVTANGGDQVKLNIGAYAFSNCHFLYNLSLPASLESMGEGVFSYASRLKYVNFASELNLSRTSLGIPKYAFLGDAAIEKITIPYYITDIGESAFYELSLNEVIFLSSALEESLSIGDYAFANLKMLNSIALPDRLSTIGNHTFANSEISNLTYSSGNSLTVGDYAFSNIKVTEINITSRITYIGAGCFSNNKLLVIVNYHGHDDLTIADATYSNSTLREISFDGVPSNVQIGKSSFENTPNLAVVSLSGNGTTLEATNSITIGERAFYNSGISKVTIKSQNVDIAPYAFNNTKLKSFEIFDTQTISNIGYLAIANNLALNSLKIIASVNIENLDDGFASYNPALTAIELNDPSKKYNASNGVVYNGTTLLAYPAGKVGSTYTALNEYVLQTTDPGDMQNNFGIYYTYDGETYSALTGGANWAQNTYYTKAIKNIAPHAFAGNTHIRNLILDSGTAIVKKDSTSFVQNSPSLTFFVPSNLVNSYINDWAVNNITYISVNLNGMVLKLLVSDRYAVEKYTGIETDIVINSKVVDGDKVYNVVSIADDAFNQNISIRKVTLTAGIEKVGKYAFANCTQLETFISGSMLTIIDVQAFQNCTSLKYVTLTDGLKTIERFAFENCTSLESIVLPDSLQTIGKYSFANCSALTNIDLGTGLLTIGDNSFENCISLVSISIPESVLEINSYVFANCETLSYVYVNSITVPALEKNGFALTLDGIRILVPENLLFIFKSAINWSDYNAKMLSKENICEEPGYENYIIEKISGNNYRLVGYLGSEDTLYIDSIISEQIIITEIGSYAINHFAKHITLAEGIINVNEYAFYNAKNLTNITLPSTLETINNYAFADLDSLTSVVVSNFVNEQIVIPNLTTIGAYAFYNTSITSIIIPEMVASIGDYAFGASKEGSLREITFKMKDPQDASLPFGKLKIGKYVFMNSIHLKQIIFDCYVDTLGEGAFNNCTSLRNIYFNSTKLDAQGKATKTLSAKTIFANCDNLTVFVRQTDILNNFRSSWQNDSDKNKLYLASNVVRDTANMVIYIYESGEHIVVDTFNYFVLEIPQGSNSIAYIKNYIGEYTGRYIDQKDAQVGDKTDTDLIIPSKVVVGDQTLTITQISPYAFNNKITSVVIPDSVEIISSNAFYNATSLKSVTFSSSSKLTTISNSAFENCSSLTSFHIPASVKNIGEGAFKNCTALSSITFAEINTPDELDSLEFGKFVFENCVSLTLIDVPTHVTIMGEGIFKNATKLAQVNFDITDSKITTINAYAFQNTALSSIKFPQSLQNVGNYAFDGCLNLTSVYLTKTSSPPTATSENVFNNIPNPFIRVYVPFENYQNYSRLEGWKTRSVLADQKDDNNKFNYILTGAKGNETATITNYLGTSTTLFIDSELQIDGVFYRVSAISSYAGNTKINKVEFSETSYLATLSDYSFANCTSLREIHLPDSVTSIGKNAFYGCNSLTDITLPRGINMIDERTFFNCTMLTEITLPSNVLQLGEAAFGMCSNLNRIIVEMEGTSISPLGSGAFTGVSKHFVIVVPTQSKTAFINEWHQYASVIVARNEMYGDYIIKESLDSIAIVQYNGYTDELNFDEITIKGKKITEVYENAFVDETLKYMIAGEWRKNGKVL